MFSPMKNVTEIGQGNLKIVFSPHSGLVERMYNSRTGVMFPLFLLLLNVPLTQKDSKYNIFQANIAVRQDYFWYASNGGDDQNSQVSGAYIFRPNASLAYPVSPKVSLCICNISIFLDAEEVLSSR